MIVSSTYRNSRSSSREDSESLGRFVQCRYKQPSEQFCPFFLQPQRGSGQLDGAFEIEVIRCVIWISVPTLATYLTLPIDDFLCYILTNIHCRHKSNFMKDLA